MGASLTTGHTSISKSKSFRDGAGKNKPKPIKYRKNKTTNLDKLTSSMSAHTIRCGEENSSTDDNETDEQTNSLLQDRKSTLVAMSSTKRKSTYGLSGSSSNTGSTSSGFMQNMTSMFKNIR